MSTAKPVTFVVSVNDMGILENNFLASPCFRLPHFHQILLQRGFSSAAGAYNDAIDRSENDLIVFAHQDILFLETWLDDLQRALDYLDEADPNWGVLGCMGGTADGGSRGLVYSHGLGMIGRPLAQPAPVQTLDEIVLVIRKSSGLRFDTRLRHFHFYGAEICLSAAKVGMKSYVIPSFCIHNTQLNLILPREFYRSYWELKRIWKEFLPIQTTCIRMTRFNLPLYQRRVREFYLAHFGRKQVVTRRLNDVSGLLESLQAVRNELIP